MNEDQENKFPEENDDSIHQTSENEGFDDIKTSDILFTKTTKILKILLPK